MLPHHHLYGLAWGAAALGWVLCGTLLLRRRAGAAGARVLGLLALAVVAAAFGARLHFVLLAPDLLDAGILRTLLLPLDDAAGLRIGGGLLLAGAVVLALGPRATHRRLGRAEICDVLVPLGGLAIAVGRLGCFADGCCFGAACKRAWCLAFPSWSPAHWSHLAQGLITEGAPLSLPVHPLQLYLAGVGVASFAAATLVAGRGAAPGSAALVAVLVLTTLRTLVEPLRETSFGAGVPHQTALDLGCAALAAVLLIRRERAQRRATVASAAGS
jgi:phosphatidylglycerol:prolipoprotein diacylglycerol transferase